MIASYAFCFRNIEHFWDRSNIVPIPPPRDYPQYINPDYQVNQYLYNTGFVPYTPSYLTEVPSQQQQMMNERRRNPWFFSNRDNFQEPTYYPDYKLPAQLIGCGSRRGACMGGTENPIPNILPPINISNQNIAPVNLTVRGFDAGIQQVGTVQKVFGDSNMVYPLFGRRKYNNDNKWEYFTKFGKFGVILPVFKKGKGHYNNDSYMEELSTNDPVWIQGQKEENRVIIYDQNIPQYLGIS